MTKQLTGALDPRSVKEVVYADFLLKRRNYQLFGNIDEDQSFAINQVADYLRNTKGDVTVYINSPGGSVYAALSIFDELVELGKVNHTTAIVTGICMSAAVTILQAFTHRTARRNSTFMVHEVSSMSGGSLSSQDASLKHAKGLQKRMLDIVKNRIKVPWSSLKLKANFDKYLTAEEALAIGLIDEIL